jgi:hypothetical protein
LVVRYLFFLSTRKKHAVNFVFVGPLSEKLFSFKGMGKDEFRLIVSTKELIVSFEAAAARGSGGTGDAG